MIDLSKTIEPSGQQLNADDLIAGPRTITVTGASEGGSKDQPILIHYEGENGRPYKPCKSMRRLLVKMWGKDGDAYAGRALTLFCDPTVTFGPDAVGGIRISHMSHIERDETMMLTASRGKKKPYQVRKLMAKKAAANKTAGDIEQARTMLEGADADTVEPLLAGLRECSWTKDEKEEIKQLAVAAKKRKHTSAPSDDPDDF